MNPWLGLALVVAALGVGYQSYGWPGVALAFTVTVFWLLLQFGRMVRVMRSVTQAPVGQVASAVMLNAKLRKGLRLIDILPLTRSLGRQVSADPECWVWQDEGGAAVEIELRDGLLTRWTLRRTSPAAQADAEVHAAAP
jgi:hypothetical protein